MHRARFVNTSLTRKRGKPGIRRPSYSRTAHGDPYDEFVCEQLAGDLVAKQGPADKYAERMIATSFIALSRRYATAPYELMHLTIEDTIDTTGQALLGLTLRCARWIASEKNPLTARVMVNRIWQHHFGRGLVPTPSNPLGDRARFVYV